MQTVLSENALFEIRFLQIFDVDEDAVSSFFELVQKPNRRVGLFTSFDEAERALYHMLLQ